MNDFTIFKQKHIDRIEKEMANFIESHTSDQSLKKAMLYSIQADGKRLRPLLLLATINSFNCPIEQGAYQTAAALEMLHTYSLIHDDLPAMDNDDLRRGKPTNHKIFGEALAILAGDGLLTGAFQLLALSTIEAGKKILLTQLLGQTAGTEGMVAGQSGDLQGEKKALNLQELSEVHRKKTGALIEFSFMAGGILANQSEEIIYLLKQLANAFGLAFQIRDDLLDVIGSEEKQGKKIGRDQCLNKSTYPALLGIEKAKEALTQQVANAKNISAQIGIIIPGFQPKLLEQMISQLKIT
ncbi:farnesyl diphosphate synthase [Melissococcus plutonius]|uniref:polyprenyl synthetase family protein n=1 Tax=Melissococcus plutonius TaxID=33970 RepID=UPI00065DE9B3|nr:farnesyl diphosphate synthase [Melissococcus plutonius]KMT32050.1 farnesyl diphosphate synthase [Melissococcus plutonius]KMT34620.1 farnesyl diphosphate synthase [Melissococcus plutonius]